MPINPYRFKVKTDAESYWVNARGVSQSEDVVNYDFKLLADYAAPRWVESGVMYQIFVDRFWNGDTVSDVQPGEWQRHGVPTRLLPWDAMPLDWSEGAGADFFGGDLQGIAQKLDYIEALGANILYLTPIFTASSNHRYDTTDFYNVDPHVGGNEALAELRRALDRRGMRLILDIVVNHLGDEHPWFTQAQADQGAPTADFFTFYNHPRDYESWLGHRSLVKLNYRSQALRDTFYRHPDSILRRWLQPPYRIDGWRMDVYHMMGRQRETRLEAEIGREIRQILKRDNPEVLLLAEHSYDATPHLQGDELDSTMNYMGFMHPLRRWLTTRPASNFGDVTAETDNAQMTAEAMADQWDNFRVPLPWSIARLQYALAGSHDVTRILSNLSGDKALMRLAAALTMTYPGVPGVYYGDEIGMEGENDPDNRRPMIWDEARWDRDLLDYHRRLIHLRRTAPALVKGGYQRLFAEGGLMVFQRQSPEQQLIVVGYRGPGDLLEAAIPVWHAGAADGVVFTDLLGGGSYTVSAGALPLRGLTPGAALILERQG
jgi:alpha-glucosidase